MEIKAIYGPAEGELAIFKLIASRMQILEAVAGMLSDQYVLRRPITLELQTCGEPGARWDLTAKAVIVCYEIVQEFAQLYRSYRKVTVAAMADDETKQMAANFHSAAE